MKHLINLILAVFTLTSYAGEITLVSPFPVGGATDTVARLTAQAMTTNGTNTTVVNKPGAGSALGTNFVAAAKPDGQTLLLGGSSALVLLPAAKYPAAKYTPDSFTPVAGVAIMDFVLVVTKDFPASSLKEFIAMTKSNKFPIGTSSPVSQLAVRMMDDALETESVLVPYPGEGQVVTDLMGGHIKVGVVTAVAVEQLVKAGKIKVLATFGKTPNKKLNVPTVDEYLPGTSVTVWWMVMAPKGTPNNIVEEYNVLIRQALQTPAVLSQIASMGADPLNMTAKQTAEFYAQQYKLIQPTALKYSAVINN